MNPDRHQNALNQGDRLHWYEIESILGHGGFGITYLALDTNLNHRVAIKEYLPVEFATRSSSGDVQPISDKHVEMFEWGKKRFLDEARTLFPFRHPNIVRVLSFFEFNNTGYIVMEYVEGVDLGDLIQAGEPFTEDQLLGIINPILEGLALVHDQGFIHRDIKPRNIVIRNDGSPVLIDFGSARQALGEQTRTLTTLVSPGYSPLEQYHGASGHQGPWTDIYALGATLYAAATGKAPIDSMQRNAALTDNKADPYQKLLDIVGDKYSRPFLVAIDQAMTFAARDRPQNLAEWIELLRNTTSTEVAAQNTSAIPSEQTTKVAGFTAGDPISSAPLIAESPPANNSYRKLALLLAVIALGFFAYPRWVSTPEPSIGDLQPVLKNDRLMEAEEDPTLSAENSAAVEMDIPGVKATESAPLQTIGKISTPKSRLAAGRDINGVYDSEITFTTNASNINGSWYFGKAQELRVTIEQQGNDLLGFINGARTGRIEGSYAGNEVNFRFNIVDPGGNLHQGSGVWFVSRDGEKMVGRWFLLNAEDGSAFLEGDWKLLKTDAP